MRMDAFSYSFSRNAAGVRGMKDYRFIIPEPAAHFQHPAPQTRPSEARSAVSRTIYLQPPPPFFIMDTIRSPLLHIPRGCHANPRARAVGVVDRSRPGGVRPGEGGHGLAEQGRDLAPRRTG